MCSQDSYGYFYREFVKDSAAISKMSTPKGGEGQKWVTNRHSIDRLSIIPKFERSFVEDSDDFEVSPVLEMLGPLV